MSDIRYATVCPNCRITMGDHAVPDWRVPGWPHGVAGCNDFVEADSPEEHDIESRTCSACRHLARGKAVVLAQPTAEGLRYICGGIRLEGLDY